MPRRRALLAIPIALLAAAAAVVVAALFVLTPPPQPPPPREPTRVAQVRVVVSMPRGGARRAQSEGVANAVRLGLGEVREVIHGDVAYRVEVSVADSTDDAGVWSEAVERANLAAATSDAQAIAYVGPGTIAAARVIAPLGARASLAVLAPTLTAPALTKRGFDEDLYAATHPEGATVIARLVPSDDVQAASLARYVKERALAPVAAVTDASPYGAQAAKAFLDAAARLGLERADARDARTRFVFVAGLSPESLADEVRALKSGRSVVVGGPDVLLADVFLARAGRDAEGVVAVFVGRPVEAYAGRAGAFLRSFRDRFGKDPDPYAIYGYDAARLVLDAIRRGGGDRRAFRGAIFATRTVEGALGTWGIDAAGDTTYATVHRYEVRRLPGDRLAWTWEGELSAR